jgi:hypothetical protein
MWYNERDGEEREMKFQVGRVFIDNGDRKVFEEFIKRCASHSEKSNFNIGLLRTSVLSKNYQRENSAVVIYRSRDLNAGCGNELFWVNLLNELEVRYKRENPTFEKDFEKYIRENNNILEDWGVQITKCSYYDDFNKDPVEYILDIDLTPNEKLIRMLFNSN